MCKCGLSNEEEAYKAGYDAAIAGRKPSYKGWQHYFYICTDCGQDTSNVCVHECPERNARSLGE